MAQSKTSSLIESILNQLSGFLLSMLVFAYVIAPIWSFEVSWDQNFIITSVFTLVSIVRSYLWRRFFNSREN